MVWQAKKNIQRNFCHEIFGNGYNERTITKCPHISSVTQHYPCPCNKVSGIQSAEPISNLGFPKYSICRGITLKLSKFAIENFGVGGWSWWWFWTYGILISPLWLNSFPVIIFIILVSIKKKLVVSFEKNHPRGDHPVNNISTHLLLSLMHNVRLFFKCLLLQP